MYILIFSSYLRRRMPIIDVNLIFSEYASVKNEFYTQALQDDVTIQRLRLSCILFTDSFRTAQ
jgi:hypothetical protein